MNHTHKIGRTAVASFKVPEMGTGCFARVSTRYLYDKLDFKLASALLTILHNVKPTLKQIPPKRPPVPSKHLGAKRKNSSVYVL